MASACKSPRDRRWLPLLVGIGLCAGACTNVPFPAEPPTPSERFSHADLDAFLGRHVDAQGLVDYAAARSDRADLDRYVATLARVSPDNAPERFPSAPDRLAYWINAYNAWVLRLVLNHDPVGSVHAIGTTASEVLGPLLPDGTGFFFLMRVPLGGQRLSLYTLENRVIRGRFDEPRIHFALNCASIGCPRLPRHAFDPARLEAQLTRETDRFLAETRNLAIDREAGDIRLSSIFEWYAEDFTGWMARHAPDRPATLPGWIALHGSDTTRSALRACSDCTVRFVPYDWGLNAQAR